MVLIFFFTLFIRRFHVLGDCVCGIILPPRGWKL